jgi:hypothetical protein
MWVVFLLLTFIFCCGLVFHLRYPIIYKKRGNHKWSVGMGIADSLHPNLVPETVINHEFVINHLGGEYIADPFVVQKEGVYYLFVEHVIKNIGKISVLKSLDYTSWEFCGVVLDEPFHQSYPQVFEQSGEFYMIPESRKSGSVRLYKSVDFPLKWKFQKSLITGQFTDPSILNHNELWYIFTTDHNYFLRCFVSKSFDGDYREHPKSPLGIGNCMRPAGSFFNKDGKLYLPVQNRSRGYGSWVSLLLIKELSPDKLCYRKQGSFLKRINHPLFEDGNHHISYFNKDGKVYFAIDGNIGIYKSYWRLNLKASIRDNIYDILTFFKKPRYLAVFDK